MSTPRSSTMTCSPYNPVRSSYTWHWTRISICKVEELSSSNSLFREMETGTLDAKCGNYWVYKPKTSSQIPYACGKDFKCTEVRKSSVGREGQHCLLLKSSEKSCGGLAEAARYALNDAMLVSAVAHNLDERARSDVFLLAQKISRMDMRAREGVALLGSGFLRLDARARKDVEKLDMRARKKMTRLRYIALGLNECARMELRNAAEEHWSDGALDADLRLADVRARRRAMEDVYVALQVVKTVQSGLVSSLCLRTNEVVPEAERAILETTVGEDNWGLRQLLEGSNKMLDRLTALEDAYWSMASALAEVDSKDCTDPDELEFIVAALLDMEEVDGSGGASLVAKCASSPDVATRRALADALADAPSMWTLGNAGMGALQRLADDSNPAVAAAACRAIDELKQQWRQMDNTSLRFPLDGDTTGSVDTN